MIYLIVFSIIRVVQGFDYTKIGYFSSVEMSYFTVALVAIVRKSRYSNGGGRYSPVGVKDLACDVVPGLSR